MCRKFYFKQYLESLWIGISEKWEPRPGTFGGIRDPRPGIHLIGGTRDLRPETLNMEHGTLKLGFQQIFSVFLEAWRFWINSCALCVYAYFVCFSLPYHEAYTLLIFYHLNELLFPSFCKNFHHAAVMKSLNFPQNQW